MLKTIKIANFRSIDEEIELSFEPAIKNKLDEYYLTKDNLLKIALIYGPNASGKTNIIKAIGFLRNFIFNPPKDKEQEIKEIVPFKFKDKIKENSKFSLEFIENNIFFTYELEINKKAINKEILKYKNLNSKKPKIALVFERKNNNIKWGSKIKISKTQQNNLTLNTPKNISLLSGYLRINTSIDILETVIKFFKKLLPPIYPQTNLLNFLLDKLENKEIKKEEIIKILKNADFGIDDFEIEEKDIEENLAKFLKKIGENIENFKEIEIWFKHFKKYNLKFDAESNGTRRFYQLGAILILLAKNSYILPIDEIESSLHPDLLKFFLLRFLTNAKDSQLILTTHMRELFLETDILREDAIWFCEKKENASTDLFCLSDFENIKDESIYNFYKYGKLGAIPNIKNFLGLISDEK